MKNFWQRYVQYINRKYRRSGTLWEGRFRSCLTQSVDYVLADMVDHPRNHKWSSYWANAEGRRNDLLTLHEQYIKIARNEAERRKGYRALFKSHVDKKIDDQIREATNGNFVFGNNRFQEELEKMLGRRVIKGKAGRPKKSEKLDKTWSVP